MGDKTNKSKLKNDIKKDSVIDVSKFLNFDNEKYKNRGLTGLQNMINTCFMNSLLQCLSHTYELNEFLENGKIREKCNRKPETIILLEWDKLRKLMWSENCIIRPAGFITKMKQVAKIKDRLLFTGFLQNDLSEFLIFIMDCFHNAIMRKVNMELKGECKNKYDELAIKSYNMIKKLYKNEYSEFLEIFYGISVSNIKSVESSYLSSTPEPFFLLNLAIPNKEMVSIYDCFNLYVKTEKLGDDNKILNEKTGKKENMEKNILFWKLPSVLIFTLKRFSNDGKKNTTPVDYPLDNLDLSNYISGYDPETFIYDLYAICYHIGEQWNYGHYIACVKTANGQWYRFNDEDCQPINERDIKSKHAYCFFYRKKRIS